MKYIVLSPIGKHRLKYFERWLGTIKKLEPQPEEIIVCIDEDLEYFLDEWREHVTVIVNTNIEKRNGSLDRICSARELLRHYFINSEQEYGLWVDSDIIIPPETPYILYKAWIDENVWVIVNKYPGRTSQDRMWCGSGIMFMHRNACTMSRFWVSYMYEENGKEHRLSEDFMFFAIFDQSKGYIKKYTGKGGRKCGMYVDVDHLTVRWNPDGSKKRV